MLQQADLADGLKAVLFAVEDLLPIGIAKDIVGIDVNDLVVAVVAELLGPEQVLEIARGVVSRVEDDVLRAQRAVVLPVLDGQIDAAGEAEVCRVAFFLFRS